MTFLSFFLCFAAAQSRREKKSAKLDSRNMRDSWCDRTDRRSTLLDPLVFLRLHNQNGKNQLGPFISCKCPNREQLHHRSSRIPANVCPVAVYVCECLLSGLKVE